MRCHPAKGRQVHGEVYGFAVVLTNVRNLLGIAATMNTAVRIRLVALLPTREHAISQPSCGYVIRKNKLRQNRHHFAADTEKLCIHLGNELPRPSRTQRMLRL